MMLREFFDILQFLFMVALTVFCACFLNYPLLFANSKVHLSKDNNDTAEIIKISLSDGIYSFEEAMSHMHWTIIIVLLVATLFLLCRLAYAAHNAYRARHTREFFVNALKIDEDNLLDVTWDEVKKQLMEVQVSATTFM